METWMTNFHALLTLDNKLLQTDASPHIYFTFVTFSPFYNGSNFCVRLSLGRRRSGSAGAAQVSDM